MAPTSTDDIYERLRALPADDLARALSEIAENDPTARARVERMVQTPKEAVKRFKARLAGLRRATKFIPQAGSAEVARDLEVDLNGLREAGIDPCQGAELVAAFFATAESVFHRVDDSYGAIASVFRYAAADLFVDFAARCDDKPHLRDLALTSVLERDDFDVSTVVASRAAEYLPEAIVRELIDRLLALDATELDRHVQRSVAGDCAAAIGDPELFERIRRMEPLGLDGNDMATIARLYLDRGDAATARDWIERIPDGASIARLDELRMAVYESLGDRDAMEQLARSSFEADRSIERFQRLVSIVGDEHRDTLARNAVGQIVAAERFSEIDVTFLLDIGAADEVDEYVASRAGQIRGDSYFSLVPLAKRLEEDHPLAATIVYRALTDSILRRAKSTIYGHAARYITRIDALAPRIGAWRGVPDHAEYMARLASEHGRKTAFWSRVEGKRR